MEPVEHTQTLAVARPSGSGAIAVAVHWLPHCSASIHQSPPSSSSCVSQAATDVGVQVVFLLRLVFLFVLVLVLVFVILHFAVGVDRGQKLSPSLGQKVHPYQQCPYRSVFVCTYQLFCSPVPTSISAFWW